MLSFIQNQILSLASFKERVQIVIPHNKAIVPATFSATEIGSFQISYIPFRPTRTIAAQNIFMRLLAHRKQGNEITGTI